MTLATGPVRGDLSATRMYLLRVWGLWLVRRRKQNRDYRNHVFNLLHILGVLNHAVINSLLMSIFSLLTTHYQWQIGALFRCLHYVVSYWQYDFDHFPTIISTIIRVFIVILVITMRSLYNVPGFYDGYYDQYYHH